MQLNPTSKQTRDPKLDFLRGLALLIIAYDHIINAPGLADDVPWFLEITPIYWGLTSATAIFVFISGQVYGLAYGARFDASGLGPTSIKSGRRVLQLYLVNLGIFVACWIFLHLLRRFGLPITEQAAELFHFESTFGHFGVIAAAAALRLDFWCGDILTLYMLLVAVGPLMLWGLARRPGLTVAISVALYVGAQFGWSIPWKRWGMADWFFNPVAWQLLFLGGMGLHRLRIRFVLDRRIAMAGVMVLLVVAAYCWLLPRMLGQGPDADGWWAGVPRKWEDRHNLFVLRVLYFVVLAVVVRAFLPASPSFWEAAIVRSVSLIGRHSLPVFALGVVATLVARVVNEMLHLSWPVVLPEIVAIAGASYALATSLELRKQRRRSPAAPSPGLLRALIFGTSRRPAA